MEDVVHVPSRRDIQAVGARSNALGDLIGS